MGKIVQKRNFIFLLQLGSILFFSSCGIFKNAGIEKRLYRPGYSITGNSTKPTPSKNTVFSTKNETKSDNDSPFEVQSLKSMNNAKELSSSFSASTEKTKTIVSNTRTNSTNTFKSQSIQPAHKVETVLKTKKAVSTRSTKLPQEGKTYSATTVFFVGGSILILWGLISLWALFPIMSASIALALTIIIGLALVIIWGLIVLMIKAWYVGDDEKK
ncbi:MAG: hypothetical protein V4608_00985 [Bacteroidota bacterium]